LTVEVVEVDGRHRASVHAGDADLPCCTAGHADALEAAAHAWRLTRAIARKAILAEA
jgi:hypothetical protein